MKKGMILVAKKTVKINRLNLLTKGKAYPVEQVSKETKNLNIIDDQKRVHWFDFDRLDEFFTIEKPCDFQEFFSFMSYTHGLILTNGQMWDILHEIEKLQEKLKV
jgi:hypothetical protein